MASRSGPGPGGQRVEQALVDAAEIAVAHHQQHGLGRDFRDGPGDQRVDASQCFGGRPPGRRLLFFLKKKKTSLYLS